MDSDDISQLTIAESEVPLVSEVAEEIVTVQNDHQDVDAESRAVHIPHSPESDTEKIEEVDATLKSVETEIRENLATPCTAPNNDIPLESTESHEIAEDFSPTEDKESITDPAAVDSELSEMVPPDPTPSQEEQKKPLDKKEKLESLRYGDKGRPVQTTPKAVHRPDADLLKMMKQSSTKLKSFDYSKLKGKKKELTVATEVISPPSDSVSPGKLVISPTSDRISRIDPQVNRLSPKKLSSFARDGWKPPGGHYYEYEDLVAANITKDYGDLQENHLEAYLPTSDFEKVFGMNRKMFYDLPDWRQHQLKREKRLF